MHRSMISQLKNTFVSVLPLKTEAGREVRFRALGAIPCFYYYYSIIIIIAIMICMRNTFYKNKMKTLHQKNNNNKKPNKHKQTTIRNILNGRQRNQSSQRQVLDVGPGERPLCPCLPDPLLHCFLDS